MPNPPTVAWMHDRLVPWAEAVVPVEDRGLQFGESLYEVVPVTAGRPRLVEAHAARLLEGAQVLGLQEGAPDLDRWHAIAAALIDADAVGEGLLYAQLTGGAAPRGHLRAAAPCFFAYLQPHRFPRRADVTRGVAAVTVTDQRWDHCDLKTTMLLAAVLAKREAARRNADEAILVSRDGEVLEGASSTVFAVSGTRIVTPPPSSHLLPGTMATLVEEAATAAGLEVVRERLDVATLAAADEIFLSATSRLVMAVVAVDDREVGDGAAGPVTRDLAHRLRRHLEIGD